MRREVVNRFQGLGKRSGDKNCICFKGKIRGSVKDLDTAAWIYSSVNCHWFSSRDKIALEIGRRPLLADIFMRTPR